MCRNNCTEQTPMPNLCYQISQLGAPMGTDLFWDNCWVYWTGVWIKQLFDASKSIKDKNQMWLPSSFIPWDEEHLPLLLSSV